MENTQNVSLKNNVSEENLTVKPKTKKEKILKYIKYNWQLYVLFLPSFIWMIFFVFTPFIENVIMSLQDYDTTMGIAGSKFIGFENYKLFFSGGKFWTLLGNTLILNLLCLVISFPLSIILAIRIYESKSKIIKGFVQTATFLPFFVSAVVVCNLAIEFLKADTGMIVNILSLFGAERKDLLEDPNLFRWIYAIMDLWQTVGYNSLIFIAALSAIDTSLFEAASIDGAGKYKQIMHVTLPGIAPTIVITLILRVGKILSLGYEKVLLLQNEGNMDTSEIISTYVYNYSLNPKYGEANYGLAATIGLFDAVVAIILVTIVNKIARRVSDTALW